MSLMKMLARVAIGVAVAKGAKSMMNSGNSRTAGTAGSAGGLGGLLGGLTQGGSRGGMAGDLGGLLGGRGATGGGLGGLLDGIGGRRGGGGGLGAVLGGLAGGAGLGGLLSGRENTLRRFPEKEHAPFGTVLNSQFEDTEGAEIEPSRDQEALAALMLSAMIQVAKSDGTFDADERARLMDHLGEADAEDEAFIEQELQKPVDVDTLVRETPKGMEGQIYAISLLGIDLDTQAEAQYLHKLAQGYGMTPEEVNEIHAEMGVPSLYT